MSADINCTGDSKRTHTSTHAPLSTINRQTITTNHHREKMPFFPLILPINKILFIFSFRSRKFSLLITYVFYRVVYDEEREKNFCMLCLGAGSAWCGVGYVHCTQLNELFTIVIIKIS